MVVGQWLWASGCRSVAVGQWSLVCNCGSVIVGGDCGSVAVGHLLWAKLDKTIFLV